MLFRVLGPVEIDGTDAVSYIGARKPRTLLALLLLKANTWVSVDELVDSVWAGQTPPASAERNIGTYIWQLRKTLPPLGHGGQRIESRSGAYRIRVEAGELDTQWFETLLTTGTEALAVSDPAGAMEHLRAARALWRGTPFEGLVTDAHQAEVARLGELHWAAREQLADALIGTGQFADAIALCTSLTTEDPLRESVWARLFVAFRDAGRKADALATYQRARATLVRELGTEPGPELRQLQQSLLNADVPDVPEEPDQYVRTALDTAAALNGPDAGQAQAWLEAERGELATRIAKCVTSGDVANAWLLTSALHQYVESGGTVDNWVQLVAGVAAAAKNSKDWYGELIVRNILGIARTRAGQIPEARAEFTAARTLAAGHDDREAEGTVLVNLAFAEADAGARHQAGEYLRRALHLLPESPTADAARKALAELGGPPDPAGPAAAAVA